MPEIVHVDNSIRGASPGLRTQPRIAERGSRLPSEDESAHNAARFGWHPTLPPDGGHIAALSNNAHLLLFDMKLQKWTELTKSMAAHPAWSKEGKYVYFTSTSEGEPAFHRVQINDRKLERVTSLKDVKRPTSASRFLDRLVS